MSDHLIIFIKNPEKGKVKTRIAATVGQDVALDIYHQLLTTTKSIAIDTPCQKHLYYSDFIDCDDDWSQESFRKYCQHGIDLGERMKNAFSDIYKSQNSDNTKVLIIGSDCPELDQSTIEKAFDYLDQNDFVLGPTFDGGYYLLGMKEFTPVVFDNIVWSADSVLAKTLSIIDHLFLSYKMLPKLNDIDTFDDWTAYKSRIK